MRLIYSRQTQIRTMADKSITEFHLTQDSSNLLTHTKLTKRELKDNELMFVEPRSELETYLLQSCDVVLGHIRASPTATRAMADFLGSGVDALTAMEFALKWPSPASNQSQYRKEMHFRLGLMDTDLEEEKEHLLQICSKGEVYPRTEHWIAILLPKKKDIIRVWVYHTIQRPNFNAEQLDWVVKGDHMTTIMEIMLPVPSKNLLKIANWQWGSTRNSAEPSLSAPGEMEHMEDTMEVSRLPVIIDCDSLRYYKKITANGSDNVPQMGAKLTNFIFTEVHNIFKWRNLDGTTESAMELGLKTRCSQVSIPQSFVATHLVVYKRVEKLKAVGSPSRPTMTKPTTCSVPSETKLAFT